jgi:hypothetical protein
MLLIGCGSNDRMELIYAERCLGCHGTAGKGDGPIAASLPVPTPDFRATVQQKNVFQIRNVIKEGKGVMPAFAPALRNPEIQDMVRIVRILSQQGRDLEWWEKFEPLVWAHCGVPWEYVYGYDQPAEGEQSP